MALSPILEYNNLLEAVGNYYGVGSDQWITIATHGAGVTPQEWATILKQTPGVNVVTNKAGEVVNYTVSSSWGTATDAVTSAVNSNAQAATMANASTINVPATTTVNAQTGKVAAESGMKTVAAGTTVKTIVKDVAAGVMAVGVGLQMGANIDAVLYNVAPDFWDEHGMSTLNPDTWDRIVETKGGKEVFNTVLGIDKDTGKMQAYADQRALAYMTQYMAVNGAFDTGDPTIVIDNPTIDNKTLNTTPILIHPAFTGTYNNYDSGDLPHGANVISGAIEIIFCCVNPTTHDIVWHMFSKIPFTIASSLNSPASEPMTLNSNELGYNGETFYYLSQTTFNNNFSDSVILPYMQVTSTADSLTVMLTPNEYNTAVVGYILLYQSTIESVGVEGITPQIGAILPTGITAQMSIDDVLTALQTQYPDLFNAAIYNDVIQEDGTSKRYIYVPIGLPENVNVDEYGNIQPTGGEYINQDDSTIDPTITPENVIDQLLKIITATDPYNPTTNPTDTTTDYPTTGDGITPPFVLPTGSASALYSVYNPSQAQLNSLGAWLWSSNFVDQLLKLFNDPMQAIIGLHKVFASPSISGTGTIKVGYLDSGVGSNLVGAQYTEVDCGVVQLKEYFGNALDYLKTDVYLYLPFVGIVPLNVEDVTRATISVKYKVDVLTGACLASVNVTRDGNAGGQLYVYAGNCAVQYPLSSGSYMGIVASALGIAGSIAGTVLSGGAMLPMALGVGASALGGARTKVEHSGSLSGNSGAMGIKKPYLIIRRPQAKIANNYELLAGVSQNEYGVLSSYTGQTRVKYVHLENIPATDKELTQIEELLKSGVLI